MTHRYLLSFIAADSSGQQWFTAFDDVSNIILGISASELSVMKDQQTLTHDSYSIVFNKATFKEYLMKARSKFEIYQDEGRVKTTVVSITPIDYVDECRQLLEAINRYQYGD